MNVTQYVDDFVKGFVHLHNNFEDVMFHGKGVTGGMEEAKRDSISEYVYALFSSCQLSKANKNKLIVVKKQRG